MKKNIYDLEAKRILSKKDVLVNIMQALIPEYKDLSFEEVYKLIDDNEGNSAVTIKEEVEAGTSKVINDLIVTPKLPNSDEIIGMYIGIESQNYYTEYDVLYRRAIFYASALINRQKGEVFTNDNYGKLKKVYSIWICANPMKRLKNTILRYQLIPQFNTDDYNLSHDYDYFNIIFLNIGDNYDYESKDILKMLSLIFNSPNLLPQEITKILEKGYNVDIKQQEAQGMINFSEDFRQEGIYIGKIENSVNVLHNAIKSFNVDLETAIKALKIDESILEEVKQKYKEKYGD